MTVSVREALRHALGKTMGYEPSEFASGDLEKFEAALEARGFAVVPLEMTAEMEEAASVFRKIKNIWPAALKFRPRVGKEG